MSETTSPTATPERTTAQPTSERRRWLVAAAVIVGLAVFGWQSFTQSLASYTHDFAEVQRRAGELLQVPGVVDRAVPASALAAGGFEFTMVELETRGASLRVRYRGVKPGNFDEARQVVCVGRYRAGVFEAEQLLVKCPSKEQEKLQGQAGSAP